MRPLHLVVAFALGACSTAAVQSAAQAPRQPAPAQIAQPAEAWMPQLSAVVVKAAAVERRDAPNGKGRVEILARGHNAFVARLSLDAGAAVPEHRDATEEYIHVVSGAGTMTVDGTDYAIGSGDTVFMPANALVRYQNGGTPMVALQVFAGPEPAAKYGGWPVVTAPGSTSSADR